MRLFGRSPVPEKFVAEAVDLRPSRRALLHAAWALGPEPILIVDAAACIRAANPAAVALLGIDAPRLEGRTMASLLAPEDAAHFAPPAEADA